MTFRLLSRPCGNPAANHTIGSSLGLLAAGIAVMVLIVRCML